MKKTKFIADHNQTRHKTNKLLLIIIYSWDLHQGLCTNFQSQATFLDKLIFIIHCTFNGAQYIEWDLKRPIISQNFSRKLASLSSLIFPELNLRGWRWWEVRSLHSVQHAETGNTADVDIPLSQLLSKLQLLHAMFFRQGSGTGDIQGKIFHFQCSRDVTAMIKLFSVSKSLKRVQLSRAASGRIMLDIVVKTTSPHLSGSTPRLPSYLRTVQEARTWSPASGDRSCG